MRQLIIFDFDGTLAESWRDIATALNRTLRDVGLPPAADADVRRWIGEGVRRLVEQALPPAERLPDRIAALAGVFSRHYEECYAETTVLYPGIADCLARLRGHTLAILSNKPSRFLGSLAAHLGIAGEFAAIVGGDQVPAGKPYPAAVESVVAAAGVTPDVIWIIGDSAIDVATGRAVGARTIGCGWGLRGSAELHAAGADHVVASPAEIPPLIGPVV